MVMNQNVHLTNENQVTNGGRQLSFNDFNFSDHSVLSAKVRILEKKNYYHTNSQSLSMPFPRQQEQLWIRKLGMTFPNGCSNNI